jgi:hemerythrin-like domain-containing protein
MKETKPVKRSKQLAPLSREHHDALLFTWKIKQGLKNGTPPAEISDYIKWYWDNNLKEHFAQEEKILLPYVPGDGEMAKQLKNEHKTIRSLMLKEMNKASLVLLADILNAHIRFEERIFFPYIEQTVSAAELNNIFQELNLHPGCQSKWHNEFWVVKK